MVDAGRKQLAVQLMGVFDAEVEDLHVIKSHGREAVRVTHASRGVVDLSSFGDGVRRAAALALTLTRASQGVLLIDEIESGIDKLRTTLEDDLEVLYKHDAPPDTIGVFLDSDNEPQDQPRSQSEG